MKYINSLQHPIVQMARQLSVSAHQRKKSAWVILEGEHLCAAYTEKFGFPRYLCINEELSSHPFWLAQQQAGMPAECMLVLNKKVWQSFQDATDSPGIMAIVDKPHACIPKEGLQGTTIVLDRLQDPGNVGTILRTAATIGIQHVVLLKGTAHGWSPKILRSAQGAHFFINIYEGYSWQDVFPSLPLPIMATNVSQKSQNIYQTKLPHAMTWVFGNEGQGVDPTILAMIEQHVYIPQPISTIDSLNVGVAVGVCLYEQLRQTNF